MPDSYTDPSTGQSVAEPLLSGWTMQAGNTDGQGGTTSQATDSTGCTTFTITGIPDGGRKTVTVNEVLQPSWVQSAPNSNTPLTNTGATDGVTLSGMAPALGFSATVEAGDYVVLPDFGNYLPATAPSISKSAAGSYLDTFGWGITKSANQSTVQTSSTTDTATYTVTVTPNSTGGLITMVAVTGTITITNSYQDGNSNTIPIQIDGITDQLSDGTVCTVNGGGAQQLTLPSTQFSYSCNLRAVPTAALTNTATVSWSTQQLTNGASLLGGSQPTGKVSLVFTPKIAYIPVTVTDTFNGASVAETLGSIDANGNATKSNVSSSVTGLTLTGSAPGPWTFTYTRQLPAKSGVCTPYPNTASLPELSESWNALVTVCNTNTGALTMGFWQNNNGQGIISKGTTTSNICNSAKFLRAFGPFGDLSATASCSTTASYVSGVIKAANASGSSMNAMLKAQMLATALDVYFSTSGYFNSTGTPAAISWSSTAGTNAIPGGGYKISGYDGNPTLPAGGLGSVKIDLTHVCAMLDSSSGSTCSGTAENASSAFGGNSSFTVLQLLSWQNIGTWTNPATMINKPVFVNSTNWYQQVKSEQQLAKDTFDAINNQKANIAP